MSGFYQTGLVATFHRLHTPKRKRGAVSSGKALMI